MRVTMSYGVAPSPCGVYARGETEDYTVDIAPVLVAQRNGHPGAAIAILSENNTILIYPNPASDILYLKGISKTAFTHFIEIYDVAGRKILINTISGNSVNISTLKAGIYFIRIILPVAE